MPCRSSKINLFTGESPCKLISLNQPDRLQPYRSGVFQAIIVRAFPQWRKSCLSSQISVINILLYSVNKILCIRTLPRGVYSQYTELYTVNIRMRKVHIMISTRQGMLRKYLLVCRHLMNNWSWNPLANYTGWSSEQIRRYRNLTALKFLLRMQQTKKNCHDQISLLILFRLS